jgi:hypothetical protein
MRDVSKFCRIYCHSNHRKWAELIPHIENWLNNTVVSATYIHQLNYCLEQKGIMFQKCLPNLPKGETKHEKIQEKIAKAYERMRQRAHDRKNKRKHGNVTWKPRVDDKVLIRTQPSSDAIAGVTGKFIRP